MCATKNHKHDTPQRILVVDDDPNVLELLKIFISSFGHEYLSATNGAEAVEQLKRHDDIGIIITDIVMPKMDGMALLKHTRDNFPQTDVIAVTGHAESITYTDVINAGAIDFISKPFTKNELEAKLNRAIRERHIIQELKRLSISDSLTGLFNRRQFDAKLLEEAHRADRQGYDIFLALLDIDNFKQYNDSLGHQEGDRVLIAVGDTIRQCIRKGVDSAFRFGGDEFAVIIPQTTSAQAIEITERIINKFSENPVAGALEKVGLSVGVAPFQRRSAHSLEGDIRHLVKRADTALYEAKKSGRNRVILDKSLTSQSSCQNN